MRKLRKYGFLALLFVHICKAVTCGLPFMTVLLWGWAWISGMNLFLSLWIWHRILSSREEVSLSTEGWVYDREIKKTQRFQYHYIPITTKWLQREMRGNGYKLLQRILLGNKDNFSQWKQSATISSGKWWIPQCWTFECLDRVLGHLV